MKSFIKNSSSMIQNVGMKKCCSFNKISLQVILTIFLIMSSLIPVSKVHAQGTPPPYCSTCTAEDIKFVGVDIIADKNIGCYNPGENVKGNFRFTVNVTAKQRYGLVIYFEIWVNGVMEGKYYACMVQTFDQGIYSFDNANGYPSFPVPDGIPPGQIMIKNMFTAWDNQYPDLVCGKTTYTSGIDLTTTKDDEFTVDCFHLSPKCKFYAEVPCLNLAVKPSVSLASIMPAVCPGVTGTTLSFNNRSNGADEYQIAYDMAATKAGFSNLSYQLLGQSPIALDVPAGAPSAVYNGVLTIRNTTTKCESVPYNFTVTIKDNVSVKQHPTVSDTYCTSGPAPELKVVAGGESPYTYQWYSNGSPSNAGGSPITDATTDTYVPPVTAVGTLNYYAEVGGGCGPNVKSNPVSVVINKNTAILDGGQPASKSEYCRDISAQPLKVSAEGANLMYQWYKNSANSNMNGTAIANANLSSFTPLTTADGYAYYYVVIDGKCGSVTSMAAEVLTKKKTVVNTHPSGNSYCSSSTPIDLQVTVDGHNLKYQWYYNTMNSTVGGTAIAAATNTAYKPSVASVGTLYYYIKVMGDCGDVYSNPAGITVDPPTAIGTQPNAYREYCKNAGSVMALAVVASGKNLTYQWYRNNSNSTVGGTAISEATTESYSPATTNEGSTYYYVLVRGTCGDVYSSVSQILINKLTSIIFHPKSTDIPYCTNSTPFDIKVSADGTGLKYQWYVNNVNTTLNATALTDATTDTYRPVVTQSGTKYYYVEVSGVCGKSSSDFASIAVDPSTMVTSQPAVTATYCRNALAKELVVSAVGKNLTYQWYAHTMNANSGGTAISGETNASFIPPTVTNGTVYYYVVVSGKCGSDASSVASVIVNKSTDIKTQIQSKNYCAGETAVQLLVGAVGTTLKYQWYTNSTESTVGGTAITGANSFYYVPSTTLGSPKYYYVVVGGVCGTVGSVVATINISKNTSIKNTLSNGEYCQDAAATEMNVMAEGDNLTYQWYSNNTTSTTNPTIISGQTNAAFTPPTNVPGTLYYYAVVNGFCGSNQVSNFASVLVKGKPTIQKQPLAATYCKDASAADLSVEATGNGLLYQWYSNSINSTVGGVALGTGNTQSVGLTTVGTTYYYVVVSGSCSPDKASDIVSVKVVSKAAISKSPIGYTMCRTAEVKALTVETVGDGIVYKWFKSATGAEGTFTEIPNSNTASYIPDVSVVGTVYYYVQVSSPICGSDKSSPVAVMVTDCGSFCTYTQGYYGNDGGTSSYIGVTGCMKNNTFGTILDAINAFGQGSGATKTITFGDGSSKLVLSNSEADIKKLIDLLPGGGPSGVIGGDYTVQSIGSLNNSLLAQTITLALNLGLNKGGNMIGYPLQSKFLKTEKAKECGKDGGYGTFDCADFSMLSNSLDIDGMPGLTINDVWMAANMLLAGNEIDNVDYSQMTAIVDGLNKAWDECRISIEWSDSKASCGQAYTIANNGIEAVAYPNPFVSKINISFKSLASGNATIQFYDVTGRNLGSIYKPKVIAGTTNIVEYYVPLNSPSVIFYRVIIGDKFASGKTISASRQ